ncbi:MAG: hypothetical protein M3326_12330, partial [Actinomycetota bacterium]|nr:hypothetical protein [Actinomycetota bacterium]
GHSTVWLSQGVHPNWRQVAATFAVGTGHRLVDVPLREGLTAWPEEGEAGVVVVQYPNYLGCLEDLAAARAVADRAGALLVVALDDGVTAFPAEGAPGAIVLQSPNYLGCLEDVAGAAALARRLGAFLVVAADPVSAGLLKPPGALGADVVVGEGQPFGAPLSFGGPYLGLFACRREHVRRLPGRLVGETVDTEGRRAYVTTLRTREQDIRREKASSNVCTNQTLMAVAFLVHLSWLGTAGLRELALRCARGTRYCREAVLSVDGVEPLAGAPVLREFAVRTPVPPEVVVDRMADEGFLAGVALGDEYDGGLLVAVTEKRTRAELDAYAAALEKVVR